MGFRGCLLFLFWLAVWSVLLVVSFFLAGVLAFAFLYLTALGAIANFSSGVDSGAVILVGVLLWVAIVALLWKVLGPRLRVKAKEIREGDFRIW